MTETLTENGKQGAVLVAEVRGYKSEVGKKFDKSDKNAPPIIYGIFKIHVEILGDGAPVMLSIYGGNGVDLDGFADKLGLRRGVLVAILVGRLKLKNGQRSAVCSPDAIRVLSDEEAHLLMAK